MAFTEVHGEYVDEEAKQWDTVGRGDQHASRYDCDSAKDVAEELITRDPETDVAEARSHFGGGA